MHCILSVDVKEFNLAKGVNIIMEFNDYNNILFDKKITRHKMRRIQSKKHEIETYRISKISLLCFDGKRFILDGSVHALVYFHKGLKK